MTVLVGDGVVLEPLAVELGQPGQVVVVGQDQRYLEQQVARPGAEQQVVEAVPRLRGQNQRAPRASDIVEGPFGVQCRGDRGDRLLEHRPVEPGLHLHPHEEP